MEGNLRDLLQGKEGIAVDGDFGVRKRVVSVSLGPKASGRVLKPNNSGAGFSSKKAVSGSVVGDLLSMLILNSECGPGHTLSF